VAARSADCGTAVHSPLAQARISWEPCRWCRCELDATGVSRSRGDARLCRCSGNIAEAGVSLGRSVAFRAVRFVSNDGMAQRWSGRIRATTRPMRFADLMLCGLIPGSGAAGVQDGGGLLPGVPAALGKTRQRFPSKPRFLRL
jgi:hypothetical protein